MIGFKATGLLTDLYIVLVDDGFKDKAREFLRSAGSGIFLEDRPPGTKLMTLCRASIQEALDALEADQGSITGVVLTTFTPNPMAQIDEVERRWPSTRMTCVFARERMHRHLTKLQEAIAENKRTGTHAQIDGLYLPLRVMCVHEDRTSCVNCAPGSGYGTHATLKEYGRIKIQK